MIPPTDERRLHQVSTWNDLFNSEKIEFGGKGKRKLIIVPWCELII